MFLLAPFGCIYYPVDILPEIFQKIAYALPLVYIFEEARNILVNGFVNVENIFKAFHLAWISVWPVILNVWFMIFS